MNDKRKKVVEFIQLLEDICAMNDEECDKLEEELKVNKIYDRRQLKLF